jgi:hypothetical protein
MDQYLVLNRISLQILLYEFNGIGTRLPDFTSCRFLPLIRLFLTYSKLRGILRSAE